MTRDLLRKSFVNFCRPVFMDPELFSKKRQKYLHPKRRANFLSNLFFCWTFPSLIKGFTSGFTETDLPVLLPQHKSSELGDKLEENWTQEISSNKKPTLWRPLYKIFAKEFLFISIIIFINEFIIKLLQPILIWKLITTHTRDDNEGYIYAFLIVILLSLEPIITNWCFFLLRDLSMKIRIACSSLIYRKSLKLNKNNSNKAATGQIVNLLSNDLSRFDKVFIQIHYLILAPIESILVLTLLFAVLNPSAGTGIGIFFLSVPLQIVMSVQYSNFRLKTATKTDERVSLLNEILSGIQAIKMYTWEELFVKSTNLLRKEEIHYIRRTSYLKALQNALNKFLSKGAVFLCILMYVLRGNHLRAQYVFVIKSFYNLLKQSMTLYFPEALKNIAEASVSVKRIENFLLSDEIKKTKGGKNQSPPGIHLEKVTAQWATSSKETLSNINFDAAEGQLVTILGSVGSGKTSLINVILQELPLKIGRFSLEGKVSYAGQEPNLFANPIRDNILFGEGLDPVRYNQVLEVCALSHDFQKLPFGDNSIVGDRGITLSGGQKARISLARAIYRNADIYILDDPLSAVDVSVGKHIFKECIQKFLKHKCVILATHQIQYLKESDKIYLLKEGKIVAEGDYENIRNCDENFEKQLYKENQCEEEFFDLKEKIVNKEEKEKEKVCFEHKYSGAIPLKIYQEYLFSGGWFFFGIIFLFIISQGIQSGTDYFESYWVKLEEKNMTVYASHECVYIYSGLISLVFFSSVMTVLIFYTYFMETSIKLHNKMFSAVITAKLKFFYTNSTGSILNRFSKDLANVDTNVPKYLVDTIQNSLNILSIFILVSIVNPWMLIGSTFLLTLFYCIRTFYVTTSRELKRIEAISRSPVYSHLSETLYCLETIRVFEAQNKHKKKFHYLLDANTSAFYIYLSSSTTFQIWLSLFCSIYVAIVTFSCFWGREISGGDLGLMITQITNLTGLVTWGMIQWSEFENEMTSVERIIQYENTETEDVRKGTETWPESSSIEFKDVSLKYKNDGRFVLKNLSFFVAPKEKIGIVGRTGAGKTSIISTLFRLVDFQGDIFLGGVNTKSMSLSTLRSKISIIPQDPTLFSGTVRENLDPFRQFTDCELWTILDDLDLRNFVSELPGGLDGKILEKGSNLSVGQRQLFCLARALLKENNILVLDEATANVDFKTDALIQSTIKKSVDSTVVIIAHRLHTIIECDKVLVTDGGQILEFGHPYMLLEQKGALYRLVSKAGELVTNQLRDIAKKNYTQLEQCSRL